MDKILMFKWIQKLLIDEKNRNIFINLTMTFVVKGVALLLSFLVMPAYIKFFGNNVVLGIWFTLLSVITWILSFDLGIGNGLRNKLVYCFAENKIDDVKKYISSSYIVYFIICMVAIVIGYGVILTLNMNKFLNISELVINPAVLNKTIAIIYAAIVLQLFLKIITSIMYSLQKSALPNMLALITSLSQYLFVVFYSTSNSIEEKLITLAMVYFVTLNIPLIVATVMVFMKEMRGFHPRLKYFSKQYSVELLILGGAFFWVQIMFMFISNSNEVLISNLFSPEDVVLYSVYNKIFTLLPIIISILLTPFWSAITKADAENDSDWLNKIFKISGLLALVSALANFAIFLLFEDIVSLWVKDTVKIGSVIYSYVFLIFGTVFTIQNIYSTFACGLNKLKLQMVVYTVGAVVKIPLVYLLTKAHNSWINVVAVNSAILLVYVIFEIFQIRKHIAMKHIKLG